MKKITLLRQWNSAVLLAVASLTVLVAGLTVASVPAVAAPNPPLPLNPSPVYTTMALAGHLPTRYEQTPAAPKDGNDEVGRKGMIVSTASAFVGDWVILLASGLTQTVVVDAVTKVDEFDGKLPAAGSWVKAKGTLRDDGALLATRVRPDNFEDGELVVRFKQAVDVRAFAEQYHLNLHSELLASANIYLFSTEDEHNSLAQIQDDARVRWAEFNYVNGIPNNPTGDPFRTWHWGGQDDSGYIHQHAYDQVDLAPAQAVDQGKGVVVAILDTGIALTHTALITHLLAGGWDMVDDDETPEDMCCGVGQGHGTHVAGVIAAIAPQSKLLPVRVLDASGRGNTFVLAYAIEWAAEHGADVINLSLGADFGSIVLSDAIANAVAQGIVVVAAAGNENVATPQFPAAFPNVVAVTAVDADGTKASFANYGAGWVDLAAPGVGITSTVVGPQGWGYASWGGTSMATPFVSGAAALLRAKLPAATVGELTARLVDHGVQIDALNPAYAGQLGRLLDIGAAVNDQVPVEQDYRLFLPAVERH